VKSPLKVLLLENSEDDALLLIRELHRGGFETSFERVWSESQMTAALRNRWDIIISDVVMPGFNGLTALSSLKEGGLDIPFIVVSGTLGEEFAVEAMRRGASDYLLKGRLSRLGPAVARALQEKEASDERKRAEEEKLRAAGERLQTLSRRLLEIQDVERRHIARELHDQIGQLLTAGKINLQELRHLRDPAVIRARLDDCISIIDQLLGRVRKLSLDLHPPLLDDLGLAATLEWYLQQQEERSGFRTELVVTELDHRYHPAIETACFRVVQEAVTNIVRHAKATRIRVELRWAGGSIEVSITDDGVGFDYKQAKQNAARGNSLGLLGMEERVLLVGGEFACESQPGCGTRIKALLPLQPRKPSAASDAG
jgi:signal transduction histidine kinase